MVATRRAPTRSLSSMYESVLADPKVKARFWAKVQKTDTCWFWQASHNSREPYGRFLIGSRTDCSRYYVLAHRLAYTWLRGPIPDGLTVDHLCRQPSCVRPAHMELVTMRENILRGSGVTARAARQICCSQGHQFDKERIDKNGNRRRRICSTCKRKSDKKRSIRR